MCKFHKDVAKQIATNPDTGLFNPGKYAAALVAMAHFRIEQYMPPMFGCDGFVPAEMATDVAVKALADSNLRACPHTISRFFDDHIDDLRAAMDKTATAVSLDEADLNMKPGQLTQDGFKVTCCAKPDPTINGPFLDHAVVYLFEGYDDAAKTYVSGTLRLAEEAQDPRYEAIRMAAEHFSNQDNVLDVLKQMFEDSLVTVFKAAPSDLAAGRGFEKTAGCVMCHDDDRRTVNDSPKPPTNG
jgi:hypothetical protein